MALGDLLDIHKDQCSWLRSYTDRYNFWNGMLIFHIRYILRQFDCDLGIFHPSYNT